MPILEVFGLRPQIGADVFLAPTATLIGDVVLGDEASVWFNSVVRGDVFPIRIGARTNIQDGTVIHVTGGKASTTIGSDVTVGHMALLHGCTVGNRCLIGMGSTLLDGATVGDDCIVAAGSLLPPGAEVPPRSLVLGRPARRVRDLGDDDLAFIAEASRLYCEYARAYRTMRESVF